MRGTEHHLSYAALTVPGVRVVAVEEIEHRCAVVHWTGDERAREALVDVLERARAHGTHVVEVREDSIVLEVENRRAGPYQQVLVGPCLDRRLRVVLQPGPNLVDAEIWGQVVMNGGVRTRLDRGELAVGRRRLFPVDARPLLEVEAFTHWRPRCCPGPSAVALVWDQRLWTDTGARAGVFVRWGGGLGPVPAELAFVDGEDLPVLVDAALAAGHPSAELLALEVRARAGTMIGTGVYIDRFGLR